MWKECIRKPLLVSSMCHNVCSSYLLAMLKPLSSQWICVCVWFYRQQHHELHCRQRKHPLAKLKGHFGWSLWDYLIGYTGLLFLFVILRFKWSYDWWRGLEVTWLFICMYSSYRDTPPKNENFVIIYLPIGTTDFHSTMEVNGAKQLFSSNRSSKYLPLCSSEESNKVSKWWQNFHFWVEYPFKEECIVLKCSLPI